jgi:hypothetical protein
MISLIDQALIYRETKRVLRQPPQPWAHRVLDRMSGPNWYGFNSTISKKTSFVYNRGQLRQKNTGYFDWLITTSRIFP